MATRSRGRNGSGRAAGVRRDRKRPEVYGRIGDALHEAAGLDQPAVAEFTRHHRDTVARVLRESREKEPARRQRRALAAAFEPQIQQWLDERLSVQRMIELAREVGTEAFHVAVEHTLAKEAVGGNYVRSFLAAQPAHQPALVDEKRPVLPHRDLGPTQREVERDLAFYEGYVANRDVLLAGALTEGGAR